MAFVNVNGNSVWVDNPQYDSEGNVVNLPSDYVAPTQNNDLVQNESGGYGPANAFTWQGPPTPEGQTFSQWADYLYATGQAGQDYNSGITRTINDYGWAVPVLAGAAFGGLAAAGAGAGAGAGAALTPEAYMASAGLTPGVFEGAAFTLPELAAAAPVYASPTDYMSQAGLDAGTFNTSQFTLPEFASQAPIGDQPGDYPMPGENGTANTWKPSNINPNDVTKLLDYNAAYGNAGLSLADVAKYANTARQALSTGSTLAKLLGGSGTSGTARSSVNPMQLGSLLAGGTPQTNSFLGQIKANQNPFIFTPAGQTTASEGMYDVSGSNMANALRKPYGTNS